MYGYYSRAVCNQERVIMACKFPKCSSAEDRGLVPVPYYTVCTIALIHTSFDSVTTGNRNCLTTITIINSFLKHIKSKIYMLSINPNPENISMAVFIDL